MFKRFRRKPTGRRGRSTVQCGYQVLETRRCLASVGWDGAGQGSAELTYYLGDAPAGVEQTTFENAIEQALDVWSDVADIEFKETQTPQLNDSLDITFASIDGAGGVLARAYLPDDVNSSRIAGDIRFDSSETWEIGNSLGRQAYDLVYVAVHEIGHALGLDHIDVAGSVLSNTVSTNQQFVSLAQIDVDSMLSLYAPAEQASIGTLEPTQTITPQVVSTGKTNLDNEPANSGTGNESKVGDDSSTSESPTDAEPNNRRWRSYVANKRRIRFSPSQGIFRWGDNAIVVTVHHPVLKQISFLVRINPLSFRAS